MNKLKALLIAGLLSLTSVSFATSVDYTTAVSGGQSGTITLDTTGYADVSGGFNATNYEPQSVYYELVNVYAPSEAVSFGTSTTPVQGDYKDITITVYDSLAFLTNAAYASVGSGVNNLTVTLDNIQTYYLKLTGTVDATGYAVRVSAVPVPAAGILFASALFGAGALGRRKKKSAKTSMVGAFTRAS